MKKLVIGGMCIVLALLATSAEVFSQTDDEKAIKECVMNYLEGWYSADSARMAKALSPELAKKGFVKRRGSEELVIVPATYSQMVQWSGQKPDQLKESPDLPLKVLIIEVGENIAMAKTITPDFIDYLQLAKMHGEWKIYHAVWEPPQDK
jgi:hypothetical protein